ncbi:phage terminase large subunit [Tabrizicola sp. BL-A-41-H6]|uniref:phage terminase large subunit n=1 Tax=Tabrizicola sp. BL-A-41-H6 TaxID=3421107 RepID=UPI003D67DD3E
MAPAAEKDTALVFRTSLGGQRKAFSVEGHITGQGADIIILDDPLDASDALSEPACEKVNNWIANVLMGRFNNGATGIMVLVMQRLAINDPAAFLREIEPWSLLSLPAVAEEDMKVRLAAGKMHVFAKGALLHPQLLDQAFLNQRRRAMGEAAYSAQYQQRPLPPGGGAVDVSLFKRFATLPTSYDTRFLSIDAASGSDSGSYSVIQFWQIGDGRIYLADSQRGRWPFPELRKRAIDAKTAFKVDFFLIEFASNGQALAQELWEYYPREERVAAVQTFKPSQSKATRMDLAMVPIAAGKVFIPQQDPLLQPLLSELGAFPNGANDDQVDALSQALWFFWHPYKNNRHNPEYRKRSRVIFPRGY